MWGKIVEIEATLNIMGGMVQKRYENKNNIIEDTCKNVISNFCKATCRKQCVKGFSNPWKCQTEGVQVCKEIAYRLPQANKTIDQQPNSEKQFLCLVYKAFPK